MSEALKLNDFTYAYAFDSYGSRVVEVRANIELLMTIPNFVH